MTPIIETYPVLIGFGAFVALLLVYYVLNTFIFQRLREGLFRHERSKSISKALREGKTSVAWDTANIDVQLDKLSGRTRHETRLTALQHIEIALQQSRRKLTKKQVNKLIELLPSQTDPDVRYLAVRLLSDNVEALSVGDKDRRNETTEPDLEEMYGAWKRALTVWSLELVGFIFAWNLLDQLPVQAVVSLALIAFVVAVTPLFGLASGGRLLVSALIVLAIVSGAFWLYADMTHTGRDSVSAEPLGSYGSKLSIKISYPIWLTADSLDVAEKPDSMGGHVVVAVKDGTLKDFDFEDNPSITIRDAKGQLFNGRETTKPEEKFELYFYVTDRSALISSTTTITPIIETAVVAGSVTADELAFSIELEPATWRSFRDVCKLVTTGAGGTSVIGVILAALWTLVPAQVRKRTVGGYSSSRSS